MSLNPAQLLADIISDQATLAADVALMHNSRITFAEAPILAKLSVDIGLYLYDIQHDRFKEASCLLHPTENGYGGAIACDLAHYTAALANGPTCLVGIATAQAVDLLDDLHCLFPPV